MSTLLICDKQLDVPERVERWESVRRWPRHAVLCLPTGTSSEVGQKKGKGFASGPALSSQKQSKRMHQTQMQQQCDIGYVFKTLNILLPEPRALRVLSTSLTCPLRSLGTGVPHIFLLLTHPMGNSKKPLGGREKHKFTQHRKTMVHKVASIFIYCSSNLCVLAQGLELEP